MPINYDLLKFAKREKPRTIEKEVKASKQSEIDRETKRKVRIRDEHICRVCGGNRPWTEVNENVLRSLGGKISLANSLLMCKRCHDYFHDKLVFPSGKDCNKKITFEMARETAQRIFGRLKDLPAHIKLTASTRKKAAPNES